MYTSHADESYTEEESGRRMVEGTDRESKEIGHFSLLSNILISLYRMYSYFTCREKKEFKTTRHTLKCAYPKSKFNTLEPTILMLSCLCSPKNKASPTISVCVFEHVDGF